MTQGCYIYIDWIHWPSEPAGLGGGTKNANRKSRLSVRRQNNSDKKAVFLRDVFELMTERSDRRGKTPASPVALRGRFYRVVPHAANSIMARELSAPI
jgi:hypothetical protein